MVDTGTATQVLESGSTLADTIFNQALGPEATSTNLIEVLYHNSPDFQIQPRNVAERFSQQVEANTAVIIDATWKDVVDPNTGTIDPAKAEAVSQDPTRQDSVKAIQLALSLKPAKLENNQTLQASYRGKPYALDDFLHAVAGGILLVSQISKGVVAERAIVSQPTQESSPSGPVGLATAFKFNLENHCQALAAVNQLEPGPIIQVVEPLLLPAVAESAQALAPQISPVQMLEALNALPLLPPATGG